MVLPGALPMLRPYIGCGISAKHGGRGGSREMIFAEGLGIPEGPVAMPDGTWLVVEMAPDRGCVTRIGADGRSKQVLAKTGRPNGLAVDRNGVLWVAESESPSLLRMTMDGRAEVFLTGCDGEAFLFPNDLAFGPDGALYMTDSGILFRDFAPGGRVRPDWRSLAVDGRVYRIGTLSRAIRLLDRGLRFPNGIAFGPDNNLYVSETLTGFVYRYQWRDGEIIGGRETLGNVVAPEGSAGMSGPDGMKFGADGNLYVAVFGQGDVTAMGPSGRIVQRIRTEGKAPTNLAFGLPGSKKIYVTEAQHGTLEVFESGLALWP